MFHPDDFAGTSRFEVRRRLGAGGMGVVYEAFDRERSVRVALKTLRGLGGDDLLSFKREFRVLQEVQHPNLISLGELFEDRGRWFFTMELVRGVELGAYVRGRPASGIEDVVDEEESPPTGDDPTVAVVDASSDEDVPSSPRVVSTSGVWTTPLDEERLRATLLQLGQALVAIHAAGKVHRDIKPSNILVTDAGRVVLLDFGLVVDLGPSHRGVDRRPAGTIPYMAPEAIVSGVGPEADWYGLGVVLYEMLTSRLPFEGRSSDVMLRKLREEPPPPSSVAPGVSPELERLCLDLLAIDPTHRPTANDFLRRVGRGKARPSLAPPLSRGSGDALFVGRRRELEALEEAFAAVETSARPVTVLLRGPSGIGKSSIVRQFSRERGLDVVTLSGRCYEREAVRYKAVDGVVDALSVTLARMTPDELSGLLPEDAALLARVFPVLEKHLGAFEQGSRPPVPDPHAMRMRVFAALKQLIFSLSLRSRLVVTIDDLQWGDPDGLAILSSVLSGPDAPRLLLVATCRPETSIDLPGDVRSIEVGPLAADDALLLATKLVERSAGRADPARVASASDGNPMFIDELARHARRSTGPVDLDDAIQSRVAALPGAARALLEVVCVAGFPLAEGVCAEAALDDPEEFHRWFALVRGAHLVRTTTNAWRGGVAIEAVHDRVRDGVLSQLGAEERRERSARVASVLEQGRGADPAALASLHFAAGNLARATELSDEAAERAMTALAFERAALLFEQSVSWGGETVRRLTRHADALAYAGRSSQAAAVYRIAAGRSQGDAAHVLRRREAEELLRAGHIDRGLEALENVLRDVGLAMPKTPAATVASIVGRRALLSVRARFAPGHDPAELRRFEAAWTVALGLSLVDLVRATDFQVRATLAALRAGDGERLTRALAMDASFLAGDPRTRPQAEARLAQASAMAANGAEPYTRAWLGWSRGMLAFQSGHFRLALEDADRAHAIFRDECAGTSWEQTSVSALSFWSLGYLGSMRELTRRVEAMLRDSDERGDRYSAVHVRTGAAHLVRLAADDPEGSREESRRAIRDWSSRGFTLQHVFDLFTQTETLLYEQRPEEAHAIFRERWADLRASMMLRVQTVRIFTSDLFGRIELACALRAGRLRRRAFLRQVERRIDDLEREELGWSRAMAAGLRAGVLQVGSRRRQPAPRIVRAFELALDAFRRAEMATNAAATERVLACITHDERRFDAASALMREEGIKDHDRWTWMYVPSAADVAVPSAWKARNAEKQPAPSRSS